MPLSAAGLFGGSQDVGIRYEEQIEFPSVADNEMVLWHIPEGVGERQTTFSGSSTFLLDNATYDRIGQSFSIGFQGPKADCTLHSMTFLMYRVGSPGSVTATLYNGDPADGEPITGTITTGSFDCDTITTSTSGELVTFTFSAAQSVLYGNIYAVVLDCAGADASNYVKAKVSIAAKYDNATGKYPGYVEKGYGIYSADAGATWSKPSGTDTYFKTTITGDLLLLNVGGTVKDFTLFDTGWKDA